MDRDRVTSSPTQIMIKPFDWSDWEAMWRVRMDQLAEAGIPVEGAVDPPDFTIVYDEGNTDRHEVDMDRIDLCYLTGRGNFWIAYADGIPVGYVGAQDRGRFIELRRMYVRQEYRRMGIGTQLVQALIEHCRARGIPSIRLWTAPDGMGHYLYARFGFRQVQPEGDEAQQPSALQGEMRMCLG